eukprot:6331557-Alexandrium_andersonii.AAC.1
MHPYIAKLYKPLPAKSWASDIVTTDRRKDGTVKVTGSVGLKGTQTYPEAFGAAIANLYDQHKDDIRSKAKDFKAQLLENPPRKFDNDCTDEDWGLANLDSTLAVFDS